MSRLRIVVLGSAAGGGLPQWNCGCPNCAKARAGKIAARTQSSLAVSADGVEWALINASPDLRAQISATPALHPRALRDSPIASVLVTNGDIDHIAGLLTLRESQGFRLLATAEIIGLVGENRIFDGLNPAFVERRAILPGHPFELTHGVTAETFSVPGKVPLFMEEGDVETAVEGEQTVGVRLSAGGRAAYYIPGCAAMTPALRKRLRRASLVLFDGTVWRDDEMRERGVGDKTGARMGHMAMSGPEGAIAAFENLEVETKVFVHINNTNPVLDPNSDERHAAEAAGWTIGEDGMEFEL